ncbi:restriction endonuclease subunit S [Listeria innocua]|uniref:restriction endonuclease subunit S n=1 Tax=Listeria innocua TaxID=1642 RepID=UPI001626D33C|nr:restriction endonuclease subunit S [Listeria innocua]MBC1385852.1 restriction endonuclease subunit S [Listeria innocua]
MSHSKKYSPRRRFEKFSNADDWEQRKLNDMVKLENGYAFKSTYFSDVPSKTIVLTPGNVRIGGGFKNGKGRYYNEISEFPHKFIFQPEDIFVTLTDLTPSAQMLGYPAVVPNDGIKYLHNQRLGKLTDFKGDKFFLFQLLSTDKYHKNIAATAIGTTVKHSSIQKILQYETSFPSLEEQKNIGTFFKKLDNTIALHQRKLEKIKALKTAYLSEMFPAEGETKPKRRFAGFTDDWEQHKLGDLIDKQIKGKAQLEKLSKGTVAYLDTFTLNGGKAFLTDGHEDVVETDILILWDGSKAGTVYIGFKGALGSTLKGYRTSINEQFVYQFLKYNQENIYNNYRTPNIPHVQKDFLDVFKISIPKTVEQAKLGSFFKQLDKTITLHQRKLQKLQNIKKAYLNEMFI